MKVKKCLIGTLLGLIILAVTGCSTRDTNEIETFEEETSVGMATSASEETQPDEIVIIKDIHLEEMIRDQIGKPEGELTTLDMEMVYSLNIDYREYPVYEIDGLEYAIYLGDFSYRYGALKSLSPIAELENLTYLNISYSTIEEIPKTFKTILLSRLSFIETNVNALDFLSELTNITNAHLTRSGITSIGFLENWDKVEELNLSENEIEDISPLEGKKSLTRLTLHKNKVEDISVLETLEALEILNISYNEVANISPIMQLEFLQEFTAYEDLDQKIIDRGLLQALEYKGVRVQYHE